MDKNFSEKDECMRKEGDCIEGDLIRIECRQPGKWELFRMSNKHRGMRCICRKNARAILLQGYVNVKN